MYHLRQGLRPAASVPGVASRSEDVEVNRGLWNVINAEFTDADAESRWTAEEIVWGLFGNREGRLEALGKVSGTDVVELGCGTAYLSAWLARRGARPVGVDLSPAQLATARLCQERFGISFPLVEADAQQLPLANNQFDLALSEYGASLWCDPHLWIAEAARVLRPGGRLVFLTNSPLVTMCVPDEGGFAKPALLRSQPSTARIQWPGGGIEFHPSHAEWLHVLRRNGFVVEALHELYANDDVEAHIYYDIAEPDWATQWPAEDLWIARLSR